MKPARGSFACVAASIGLLMMLASLAGCRGYSTGKRLDLWHKKLRLSAPDQYEQISFDDLVHMQPSCPYKDADADAISRQERRAISVEGYLVKLEQLADGVTYFHLFRRGDIHLEIGLAQDFHAAGDSSQRVICEITVPFQWRHKRWNLEGLAPLASLVSDDLIGHVYPGGTPGGTRVRLSGYLLDDFVHCLAVGRTRATAWEIHPITGLEVWDQKTGSFVPFK